MYDYHVLRRVSWLFHEATYDNVEWQARMDIYIFACCDRRATKETLRVTLYQQKFRCCCRRKCMYCGVWGDNNFLRDPDETHLRLVVNGFARGIIA